MTKLFGLKIYNQSSQALTSFLDRVLESGTGLTTIFTPNPEQVIQAKKDATFQKTLQQADILIPDGTGLVWAAKTLKNRGVKPIKERITGTDVVSRLLEISKKKKQKALVIGGRDYEAGIDGFSNLIWLEGFVDAKNPAPQEQQQISQVIETEKPEIVFVAFGAPAQEKWVIEHREMLRKNQVRIAMVVGGAFDFIFNKVQRAPEKWQKLGLEWLWRLLKQPWRLGRQMRLVKFVGMVLREKLYP